MKLKTYLLLISIVFVSLCYGQIVPFTYGTKGSEKGKNPETISDTTKQTLGEKAKVLFNKLKQKLNFGGDTSYYSEIAEGFLEKAAHLKQALKDSFEKRTIETARYIQPSSSPSTIEYYKRELRQIEIDKKAAFKEVEKFEDLAEVYNYYHLNRNSFRLFPVRNTTGAKLFYENEAIDKRNKFLQNSIIRYAPDGGKASIFNELFSDYAEMFRFGIGMLITNKSLVNEANTFAKDSIQQKDAIQRLIGGGGNFVANISYPLLGYFDNQDRFATKLIFAPKINMDIPQIGTEKGESALSTDIGLEGTMFYTMNDQNITIFSNFRLGYVFGNKNFYRNLLKTDDQGFAFHQLSTGVALGSTFRLAWNVYFGDPYVKSNFNQSIGLSIVP